MNKRIKSVIVKKQILTSEPRGRFLFLKKRKIIIYLSLLFIILTAIGAIIYYNKQVWNNKNVKQATDLSVFYQKQLPMLEEKAKSNTPNDLQNYGVALYATGELSKAEEVYKKQTSIDSNNAFAHNNLANILRDAKKFEEAITEYEKAIQLAPKSLNAYINLGSLYHYSLNNIDKAIEVYNKGITENSSATDLYIFTALAYEQKKDFSNAKMTFQKALEIQADNQAAKIGLERIKAQE